MWTTKNRAHYDRSKLRYPSDLSEGEWKLIEPMIPPGKSGGHAVFDPLVDPGNPPHRS